MIPIFSIDKDEYPTSTKCEEYMQKKFEQVSYPQIEYKIMKKLGGGKSGAIITIAKHIDTNKNAILKIYQSEIYNPLEIDSRPLREIYTACVMSGTEGFPIVYDFGKLIDTNGDRREHLYLISEIVSGKAMSIIDMKQFNTEQIASILLQLLNLLFVARDKLGVFIHNDLHPDNIFIDEKKCYLGKIDFRNSIKFMSACPKVSIIDFDLAISEKYPKNHNDRAKFNGVILPAAVLEWLSKCFNLKYIPKIIKKSSVATTEDLQLWNVYYMALSALQLEKESKHIITDYEMEKIIRESKMCKNLDQCLTHPYIVDNMNFKRTMNRQGDTAFLSSDMDSTKLDENLDLIIDTMLSSLGMEAIGKSFLESYRKLNEEHLKMYGTNVPYNKVILQLSLSVVSQKNQVLNIDSCISGRLGNLDVYVILPDKINIQLFLYDKKVKVIFVPKGLKILNVTHSKTVLSYLETILTRSLLYITNPIIYDVIISPSEKSTDLKINFWTTIVGKRQYQTELKTDVDIEFKDQIENIIKCLLPNLFKNKDIFETDVVFQALTDELVGPSIHGNWRDIVKEIVKYSKEQNEESVDMLSSILSKSSIY